MPFRFIFNRFPMNWFPWMYTSQIWNKADKWIKLIVYICKCCCICASFFELAWLLSLSLHFLELWFYSSVLYCFNARWDKLTTICRFTFPTSLNTYTPHILYCTAYKNKSPWTMTRSRKMERKCEEKERRKGSRERRRGGTMSWSYRWKFHRYKT